LIIVNNFILKYFIYLSFIYIYIYIFFFKIKKKKKQFPWCKTTNHTRQPLSTSKRCTHDHYNIVAFTHDTTASRILQSMATTLRRKLIREGF